MEGTAWNGWWHLEPPSAELVERTASPFRVEA
jgi:hypothetical protein